MPEITPDILGKDDKGKPYKLMKMDLKEIHGAELFNCDDKGKMKGGRHHSVKWNADQRIATIKSRPAQIPPGFEMAGAAAPGHALLPATAV